MSKNITLKFSSRGIQSDIYYLTSETLTKLEAKDIGELPPLEFIEQNADKAFNLSYGICLDHQSLQIQLVDGDHEKKLDFQYTSDYEEEASGGDRQKLLWNDYGMQNEKECEDPSENHAAAVFVPVAYNSGSIECTLSVENDFCPSDITLITCSLEIGGAEGFLNDEIYRQGLITLNTAEDEIYGLEFKGVRYEFGSDLSFQGGDGSPILYKYDQDEGIWLADYFTEVFEDDDDDDWDIETV